MGPVGVLALQGDFREHETVLGRADATTRQIRRPEDLDGISALVLPGGESTTIGRLSSQSPETDGLTRVNNPFSGNYRPFHIRVTGSEHELVTGEKI